MLTPDAARHRDFYYLNACTASANCRAPASTASNHDPEAASSALSLTCFSSVIGTPKCFATSTSAAPSMSQREARVARWLRVSESEINEFPVAKLATGKCPLVAKVEPFGHGFPVISAISSLLKSCCRTYSISYTPARPSTKAPAVPILMIRAGSTSRVASSLVRIIAAAVVPIPVTTKSIPSGRCATSSVVADTKRVPVMVNQHRTTKRLQAELFQSCFKQIPSKKSIKALKRPVQNSCFELFGVTKIEPKNRISFQQLWIFSPNSCFKQL
ncbi:hypothetical protein cgR_2692 [Corynebacterium glutamicum R]|uniref:Uncharacterized protein n=1 Tax=Corynebacterium glutamicum (strain R) TaxID=340322 RepID=A0AB72VDU5_CORGB|nr:hypothetical protein cgR_2692 [Corynebacterium glutamicum R]